MNQFLFRVLCITLLPFFFLRRTKTFHAPAFHFFVEKKEKGREIWRVSSEEIAKKTLFF